MDIFGVKKRKFLNDVADRVGEFTNLPSSQTKDFVYSAQIVALHWSAMQVSNEKSDRLQVDMALKAQCEEVMKCALALGDWSNIKSEDRYDPKAQAICSVDVYHPKIKMAHNFVLACTAQLSSYLLKPRSEAFKSDQEYEDFKGLLVKFCEVPVGQTSGARVSLIEFMRDPNGEIPMSAVAKKYLFGEA